MKSSQQAQKTGTRKRYWIKKIKRRMGQGREQAEI